MKISDEWGHDPTVQRMRRIFSIMEKSQKELLRDGNVSPFDSRLRRTRNEARDLFEQIWPLAAQKEVVSNEREAALLYKHCLTHALKRNGMEVSDRALPEDDGIARFFRGKLR
jgi:hypothetical protein